MSLAALHGLHALHYLPYAVGALVIVPALLAALRDYFQVTR